MHIYMESEVGFDQTNTFTFKNQQGFGWGENCVLIKQTTHAQIDHPSHACAQNSKELTDMEFEKESRMFQITQLIIVSIVKMYL